MTSFGSFIKRLLLAMLMLVVAFHVLVAGLLLLWKTQPINNSMFMLTHRLTGGEVTQTWVDYKQIAEKVFLITDAKKQMKALDQKVPDGAYPKFKIMGREFDAAKAAEYAKSFPIRKAA